MKASIPQNRILILEEQRIIGYDLEKQLKKKGYRVSYEKTCLDIQNNFLFGLSDIVISSPQFIKNPPYPGKMSIWNFLNGLGEFDFCSFRTETIIIDKGIGGVKCFEKPYSIEDIVSFIGTLMNKEKNVKTTISRKIK